MFSTAALVQQFLLLSKDDQKSTKMTDEIELVNVEKKPDSIEQNIQIFRTELARQIKIVEEQEKKMNSYHNFK